jgi:hypothetical protein
LASRSPHALWSVKKASSSVSGLTAGSLPQSAGIREVGEAAISGWRRHAEPGATILSTVQPRTFSLSHRYVRPPS